MLDLRALSSAGGTASTAISTIMLGNDGQTVAGVPVFPDASKGRPILRAWGVMTTIANTILTATFRSKDMVDEQNAQIINDSSAGLRGYHVVEEWLPYRGSARTFFMSQNVGAANNMAFTLDQYDGVPEDANILRVNPFQRNIGNKIITQELFASALTAITWGSQALNTTNGLQTSLKQGRYAILGAQVSALTNYGLIRFVHNSFGKYAPGFPVVDNNSTTVANASLDKDPLLRENGYQFVYLGQCPIFDAGPESTGLTIQMASITADTPRVSLLNLAKVG